uniref:Reverse transcriptase domain-containing protein n=1 Tax=Tanacetum cinerariifolium TaxID=118510 RepID=A0A6L2KSB4_TANCI|nr:hypothetical protein [Tanacetum cinerariifolium]
MIQGPVVEMPPTLFNQHTRSDLVLQRTRCTYWENSWFNGSIPSMNAADAKKAIQEMADDSQKWEIKNGNVKVYAAQVGCESCKGPHYTKDCPLKEEVNPFEEALYTQYGVPFPIGGRFRAVASHDENSILIKEIRSSTDAAIQNQRASNKALEIQIGNISKGSSIHRIRQLEQNVDFQAKPIDYSFSIRLTDDFHDEINVLDSAAYGVFKEGRRMEDQGVPDNILVGIGKFVFPVDFIVLDIPKDVKVPLILGRPFLSTAHSKIDVFEREITLRVGNENVTFKIVENMDGYRDQDIGDVIFGEPFCKDSCVEARWFDGLITIHNDYDNVTYQMARSLPEELAEQCNAISGRLILSNYCVHVVRARIQILLHTQSCS